MNAPTQSLDDFYAAAEQSDASNDGKVPRNHRDQPMILPVPGDEHLAYKSGQHKGLVPYSRASSYGSKIDDKRNIETWKVRQTARGFGILIEQGKITPGPAGGMPRNPLIEPTDKADKDAWNDFAERCQTAAGSGVKADLGTAIHYGTEVVDKGGSLADLPELIRERATAYWKFCREAGLRMVEVETFGVEDVHHVAGTWDRVGWFFGDLAIGDVKTSSTLDFGGLSFSVQLAVYAHAKKYDPATGERIPHPGNLDQRVGWIIHVDREAGGPVTLHRVDIENGWARAAVVDAVLEIRRNAKTAISAALDATEMSILRAPDRGTLGVLWEKYGGAWTPAHKALAAKRWEELAS